jgi:hypothetical protein
MEPQDWLKVIIEYYKNYDAGARPLTLTALPTIYLGYNASVRGGIDHFIHFNPIYGKPGLPARLSMASCMSHASIAARRQKDWFGHGVRLWKCT